jgi:hypothetical protein
MPRPLFALAFLALTAGSAAQARDALDPGFWIFPHEPALSAETLADLCRHGMSLVMGDGSSISYLADVEGGRNRLVIDSEKVCHIDGGYADCMTRIYSDTGAQDFPTVTEFSRDDRGNLMALSINIANGAHNRSYPQQCPAVAVRDFMVGWLALHPEG